jgi:hypothetical protein
VGITENPEYSAVLLSQHPEFLLEDGYLFVEVI